MSPKVLAVIPAAGRGSRLGLDQPKLLASVYGATRVWDILNRTLCGLVDHIHLVLSPAGYRRFQAEPTRPPSATPVSCSIQPTPTGMGDAVFVGLRHCPGYDQVLVVWGDQVSVTRETVVEVVAALGRFQSDGFCLPLVPTARPYVQYDISAGGLLTNVRQSREGDDCDATGLSDVGVFGFTCRGLIDCWTDFGEATSMGRRTGEVNLLPFLPYLSSRRGWPVTIIPVSDAREARGVNTREDLEFFRAQFLGREGGGPGEDG
jgi:CTP:molybdopterin cytidylyltransferase MocA